MGRPRKVPIKFAVHETANSVVLEFPEAVLWMELSMDAAKDLSYLLIKYVERHNVRNKLPEQSSNPEVQ